MGRLGTIPSSQLFSYPASSPFSLALASSLALEFPLLLLSVHTLIDRSVLRSSQNNLAPFLSHDSSFDADTMRPPADPTRTSLHNPLLNPMLCSLPASLPRESLASLPDLPITFLESL